MDVSWLTIGIVLLALVVFGVAVFLLVTNPSLSRNWSPDQFLMPSVEFIKDDSKHGTVRIKNIRNIHYRTTRDYDLRYYDREIAVDDVQSVWLAIAPFTGFGAAHAFISFGLADGTYLAVSIEIRRRMGKHFDPVKAFFRQFEIMYVLSDERDVIGVRTNIIKYNVRLYPVHTSKDTIRAVFCDILIRADKLGKEPEFYNTLWNNCATNIVGHARKFAHRPIPAWNPSYLFPDFLDRLAYRLSILKTDLDYKEAKKFFNITAKAQSVGEGDDFSKAIRQGLLPEDSLTTPESQLYETDTRQPARQSMTN